MRLELDELDDAGALDELDDEDDDVGNARMTDCPVTRYVPASPSYFFTSAISSGANTISLGDDDELDELAGEDDDDEDELLELLTWFSITVRNTTTTDLGGMSSVPTFLIRMDVFGFNAVIIRRLPSPLF